MNLEDDESSDEKEDCIKKDVESEDDKEDSIKNLEESEIEDEVVVPKEIEDKKAVSEESGAKEAVGSVHRLSEEEEVDSEENKYEASDQIQEPCEDERIIRVNREEREEEDPE